MTLTKRHLNALRRARAATAADARWLSELHAWCSGFARGHRLAAKWRQEFTAVPRRGAATQGK